MMVSIITPSYNSKECFGDTYLSVINQTISDIKQNDRLNPSNLKKEIERKGFSDKEKKTYIDLHNILNDYYQKFISTTEEAIL